MNIFTVKKLNVMKLKHALILFTIGWCLIIEGPLMKIMHWFSTDVFFIVGNILQVTALIAFAIKLLKHPKVKDFFNV